MRNELLAILVFSRQFGATFVGRRFSLRIDDQSLNFKVSMNQVARWQMKIQNQDYEFIHWLGPKTTIPMDYYADPIEVKLNDHRTAAYYLWQLESKQSKGLFGLVNKWQIHRLTQSLIFNNTELEIIPCQSGGNQLWNPMSLEFLRTAEVQERYINISI